MKGFQMKPELPIGYDYCKDCKQTKPIEDFPKSAGSYCRKCQSIRTTNSPNYRENVRKSALKKFGITPEDYDRMELEQNSVCAICKRQETTGNKKRLAVDHNHATGKVRGLLCSNCNTAIGKLNDSIDLLESAIKYLKYNGGK